MTTEATNSEIEKAPAAPGGVVASDAGGTPAGAEGGASGGEPQSLLDAAMQALAPEQDKDASAAGSHTVAEAAAAAGDASTAAAPTGDTAAKAADADQAKDATLLPEAVVAALPAEARAAYTTLRQQVADMQPYAERGRALTDYIQASGLSPNEYTALQDAGALIKTDPAKAREILVAKVAQIDAFLGNTVPTDIQADIDAGYITEERGRELAKTRARATAAEQAVATGQVAAQHAAIQSEVEAWHRQTQERDPDFAVKLPHIQEKTRIAVLEAQAAGKPITTPAQAIAVVQRSYAAVNSMVAAFRPKTPATARSPDSTASAPAANPTPRTIQEAAAAAVGVRW